jgi:hypothetical protein
VRGIIRSWRPAGRGPRRPADRLVLAARQGGRYLNVLTEHVKGRDGTKPGIMAGAVNAWSWTPSDVAGLAGLLTEPF